MLASYEVVIAPKSYDELAQAVEYYLHVANTEVANRLTDEFEEKCNSLRRMPFKFGKRRSKLRQTSLRTFPFVLIYGVSIRRRTVVVQRLLHAKSRKANRNTNL